ncbi:primase-helicase family protein [Hyphomicrobium sp.]|uniref:primase-helicase family protein n=1 Tax=Hyphomicrobium sp. TaxID=82 RepID=UPI001DFC2829|nr:primase-helicase family protein [Hyphomicrobium sp.]MBY0558809.1 hypothetical protein [Hyphomicrobium sp.]
MRIESLTTSSTTEEVDAAIAEIAGWPASSHAFFLSQVKGKTGRDIASLSARLRRAIRKREGTKYSRLKLKSLLVATGIAGREDDNALIIPDPLVEGDEIKVRDATLLGYKPIVEKETGYAYPVDDYVVALIGDADIKPHQISKAEIKDFANQLCDCDITREISPRLLSTPNISAFEEVVQESHDRLLITLRLNKRYSLVENAGQIVVFENETRVAYTREEFKVKIGAETEIVNVGGKLREKPRSLIWLEDPARALYRGVTFAPCDRDKHGRQMDLSMVFNLWSGFGQMGAPGDWSLLKEHIRTVLCRGDETCYEYVLNWLAHLFQKPWEKPGVAIVCWGDKRTGKGTVADAIREALGGELSRMFAQKEHVVGRFAGSAQPMMFNQIEEAVFARDPREEGPLKSKITDPTETVELKFKTPYEVPSFGRWWFNSNSSTPVPITFDEERYFVLHVDNSRASDHAYFSAIRQQLYHEGGLAAMIDELMQRDISNFNIRKPPHTEHRAKMVLEMLTSQDRAIADILIEGEVALLDTNKGDVELRKPLNLNGPTWVDKDLVRSVLNHAFKRYGAKEASAADITRTLMDLGVVDASRNAHRDREQKAAYRFLPLSAARANFADKRKIDVQFLVSGDEPLSPIEEIQDLVGAVVAWCEKFETGPGEPPNFKAFKAAVLHAQRLVQTKDPANDNSEAARAVGS